MPDALPSPLDLIDLPFLRAALVVLVALAIAGGVLGAWVVLRDLAFFAHAVGPAALPAFVLAGPVGVAPQLAGLGAGLIYAGAVERAGRGREDTGAATGLVLVASLAAGVVLASDVVTGGGVDRLLFGTALGIGGADLALAAGAAALAVTVAATFGRGWTAAGFDRDVAATAVPLRALDGALLATVAVVAVAAVPAVGALLATSVLVVPAATARRLTVTVGGLVAAGVGLALAEAVAGLYLAYALDVPPGPAVAVLGAAVYGLVALAKGGSRGRGLRRAHRPSSGPAALTAAGSAP